jgi:hypothetical protein
LFEGLAVGPAQRRQLIDGGCPIGESLLPSRLFALRENGLGGFVAPVPEPASCGLAALGVMGMFLLRLKR